MQLPTLIKWNESKTTTQGQYETYLGKFYLSLKTFDVIRLFGLAEVAWC